MTARGSTGPRPDGASTLAPPQWTLPEPASSSGCFETMRAYGGRIFRLDSHLDRLYGSAKFLGVAIADTRARLGRRLEDALERSGIAEAVVRVAMIPSSGAWGLAPGAPSPLDRPVEPSVVVVPAQLLPERLYREGIAIAVVPARKFPVGQIDPRTKFSARMGSVLAVMEAQLRGVDEAIFLDTTGSVTESTASNLGMIKDGAFIAAPSWLGLLRGVTWDVLREVAPSVGLRVREAPITRHELYNADEVFLTSTLKEVLPVVSVDGRRIPLGSWAPKLRAAFRAAVRRELKLAKLVPHPTDAR